MSEGSTQGCNSAFWSTAHGACRWTYIVFPIVHVIVLFVLSYFVRKHLSDFAPVLLFSTALLGFFIWLVLGVTLLACQCPRCGKSFHVSWALMYGNIYASKCVHCGYRMQ